MSATASAIKPVFNVKARASEHAIAQVNAGKLDSLTVVQVASVMALIEAAYAQGVIDCNEELMGALRAVTIRYRALDRRLVAGQHNEPNGEIERAEAVLAAVGPPI